jgi:hypothetical protein
MYPAQLYLLLDEHAAMVQRSRVPGDDGPAVQEAGLNEALALERMRLG